MFYSFAYIHKFVNLYACMCIDAYASIHVKTYVYKRRGFLRARKYVLGYIILLTGPKIEWLPFNFCTRITLNHSHFLFLQLKLIK